jgi:hypothetical protein
MIMVMLKKATTVELMAFLLILSTVARLDYGMIKS